MEEAQVQFENKIVLVTGAGSGIGRATAQAFARQGAHVIGLDLNSESLGTLSQDGIETIRADISDPADMQSAFDQITERHGRLDATFANAGINGTWAPIEDMRVEDWDQVMGINLRGTFLTVHHTVPLMRGAGGSIIITSSITGTRIYNITGASAYAATKGAQLSYTKMAALELARYRIRVNAVCPGRIESNIHANPKHDLEKITVPANYPDGDIPLTGGTEGKPRDIADVVTFLASDASRHVTGTFVFVDGGQSLLV